MLFLGFLLMPWKKINRTHMVYVKCIFIYNIYISFINTENKLKSNNFYHFFYFFFEKLLVVEKQKSRISPKEFIYL
jgi:hypothetical protein